MAITLKHYEICQDCDGTGEITDQVGGTKPCPYCDGTGRIHKGFIRWSNADLTALKGALGL